MGVTEAIVQARDAGEAPSSILIVRSRQPTTPHADTERRAYVRMSWISWALTATLLLFVSAVTASTPLTVEARPFPLNVVTFVIFLAVSIVYTYFRWDLKVASLADALALISAFALIAAIYTYAMAYLAEERPFWDAYLAAADRTLGFDWKAYLTWLDQRPNLGWMLNAAYLSVLKQVACLVVLLPLCGQHRRLQTFILASQFCLVVCGACGYFMPALGAYTSLGIDAVADHPHIPIATMNAPTEVLLRLRGGAPVVPLADLQGIVVFPSFHMVLAVLFAWGFWTVPFVRWIALALNIAMAAATPLSGGHYLVDLIAGAALAMTAIAAAAGLRRAVEPRAARAHNGPIDAPKRAGAWVRA